MPKLLQQLPPEAVELARLLEPAPQAEVSIRGSAGSVQRRKSRAPHALFDQLGWVCDGHDARATGVKRVSDD